MQILINAVTVDAGAVLDSIEGNLAHPEELFGAVTPILEENFRETFDEEGPGWAPWSSSYADFRQKNRSLYPIMQIGILTGALVESLGDPSGNEHSLRVIEGDEIFVGTILPYAKYFNAERVFTELRPQQLEKIVNEAADWANASGRFGGER